MKTHTLLLFPFIALLLASCDDKISPETANAFKGEYWMKTTSYTMYEGQVTEEKGPIWSPVTIYEDGGKLFVQTDSYGAPDTDTTSNAKHGYIINYPDHPNYAPAKYSSNDEPGDEEGGIENVEDPIITRVFLMDGKIWTLHKGAYLKSLPIRVKSGSQTVLNLYEFQPVEIGITSADGIMLAVVNVSYQYEPMVKNGDVITWEVTMPFDFLKSYANNEHIDKIIHKNTLYRK